MEAMLRGSPPSPRKVGDRTIAQGGKPKKLRYFAKFERTAAPQNRRPRGTGKKHILDIEHAFLLLLLVAVILAYY